MARCPRRKPTALPTSSWPRFKGRSWVTPEVTASSPDRSSTCEWPWTIPEVAPGPALPPLVDRQVDGDDGSGHGEPGDGALEPRVRRPRPELRQHQEHCTDEQRQGVLEDLARLCAPSGTVVVSVPIEVGPALLGKQLFRALAAWRRQGDYQYRETYTPRELLTAAFGRPVTRAEYVVQTAEGEHRYRGHKGFDWRTVEAELRRAFEVDRRLFTPMPMLRGLLNSQVWFVCRRRS